MQSIGEFFRLKTKYLYLAKCKIESSVLSTALLAIYKHVVANIMKKEKWKKNQDFQDYNK